MHLLWRLHDVDLHRPAGSHLRRLQSARVHRAILRFHNEQSCTFDPGYLRPVNGRCAVDVIKTYIQHSSVEAFDLTGHRVAILHGQPVRFVSREQRCGKSEEKSKNQVPEVHCWTSRYSPMWAAREIFVESLTPPPYAETNSRTRIALQIGDSTLPSRMNQQVGSKRQLLDSYSSDEATLRLLLQRSPCSAEHARLHDDS